MITNLDEDVALELLTMLVHVYFPMHFDDGLRGLLGDLDVFHIILADRAPELYVHLIALGEHESSHPGDPPIINAFVSSWLSTLFVYVLPLKKLVVVWDSVFSEGSGTRAQHPPRAAHAHAASYERRRARTDKPHGGAARRPAGRGGGARPTEVILRCALSLFLLMRDDLLKLRSAIEFYAQLQAIPTMLASHDDPLFPNDSILQVHGHRPVIGRKGTKAGASNAQRPSSASRPFLPPPLLFILDF